jgi:pyrroline-5-carboxylate reductase
MKVCIIGLGGLGGALVGGILAANDEAKSADGSGAVELVACGRRSASLDAFRGRCHVETDAAVAVVGADVVCLAVKPKGTVELLEHIAPHLGDGALVVSCAAGVTMAALSAGAPHVVIARAMPNIGAQRRASTTAVFLGSRADVVRDRARLHTVFGAVGDVVDIADEGQLHAVTAIAASGPAFVLLMIEAMVDAGVEHGLSRADALACARGALVAATSRLDGRQEPGAVRAHVTSPGGTTAAGLAVLEREACRGAVAGAVAAAVAKSKAM